MAKPRDPLKDRGDRPEIQTPWFPDPPPAPAPAVPLTPPDDRITGSRPRSLGARLPVGAAWAAAIALVAIGFAAAAASPSVLFIPLGGIAGLIVVVAAATRVVAWVGGGDGDWQTSALIAGVLAVLFGWLFEAWLLSGALSAVRTEGTGSKVLLIIGALAGWMSFPLLTFGLAYHADDHGADATLAIRLGWVSVAVSIVAALLIALLT